jgi:hypothetical protein
VSHPLDYRSAEKPNRRQLGKQVAAIAGVTIFGLGSLIAFVFVVGMFMEDDFMISVFLVFITLVVATYISAKSLMPKNRDEPSI